MKKDTRGLSSVVTSLIIILLVLVAIGIIWLVVQGVINKSGGQVDVGSTCLGVSVRATNVDCIASSGLCNVTLERGPGTYTGEIGGADLSFLKDGVATGSRTYNGNIVNAVTDLDVNATTAIGLIPNSVKASVWLNVSGEKQTCPQSTEFDF